MPPGKLLVEHECGACAAGIGFYFFDMPGDRGQDYRIGMPVPEGAISEPERLNIIDACTYCQTEIGGRVEVTDGVISGVIEIHDGLEFRVDGTNGVTRRSDG
tara:strand:- start:354 stop:659 length:306 start_codon:yes stop_codon:yes gene_type:complete